MKIGMPGVRAFSLAAMLAVAGGMLVAGPV
jgi:hypothetical protein